MDNEYNNIDEQLLKEDDRIANYLKGRMTADEEQAFMQELKSNPELKAKAIAMARLAKGLKEVGVKCFVWMKAILKKLLKVQSIL